MDSYVTVKQIGEFRNEEKKSVFIGYALPISNERDAIEFISAVKKKHPDARHWVYAYALRENSTIRYSDDREPQGTAGIPVLDVIRKNGCTDVVIVVVRYFGGTLLGTGGLVRAYTECALGALKSASIIKYNLYTELKISVSYSDYQKLLTVFSAFDFLSQNVEFAEDVVVIGTIISEKRDELEANITELTSGRGMVEFVTEKFDFREN